jgi:hypothetical protein
VFDAALVPREKADEEHRRLFATAAKGFELESVDAYLAYYAAPSFAMQEFLYPVYVYRATARVDDRLVPLRSVTVPTLSATTPGAMVRCRRTRRTPRSWRACGRSAELLSRAPGAGGQRAKT